MLAKTWKLQTNIGAHNVEQAGIAFMVDLIMLTPEGGAAGGQRFVGVAPTVSM